MRLSPRAALVLLAKLETQNNSSRNIANGLHRKNANFYHAQLAFRKYKSSLKLLNLYDHF